MLSTSATAPFVWATGIEDTFIASPWHRTGRVMDEYELTGHYALWESDIQLMRGLGVRYARYGIPWYRVNPEPGRWEWAWIDAVIDRMLECGVHPIIDLVHYGTPLWLERAFLHPDYPQRVAEYAAAVAHRYAGRVRWYTPLNEPRITAWYCGMLGWWPPYVHGWRGFLAVMSAVCRGIIATEAALRAAGSGVRLLHVDATDLYRSSEAELQAEVAHRQDLVFLALDLISGRVDSRHPLCCWLRSHGMSEADLVWFASHRVEPEIIGLNMYPMFSSKTLYTKGGRRRTRMDYAGGELLEQLCGLYWQRFAAPLFISETAAAGSLRRRARWLRDSVAAVRRVRGAGIPLIGYTWWPMFSLVAWSYRQAQRPLEKYFVHMGLWDIDVRPGHGLQRLQTPLVDAYRDLVAAGDDAVGSLHAAPMPAVQHSPAA